MKHKWMNISSLCLLFSVLVAPAYSWSSNFEQARDTINEMDKRAGTWVGAPRDEASKEPVVKRLEGAIAALTKIMETEGDHYEAAFLAARAYGMLYNLDVTGSFENTVDFAQRAMQCDPTNQDPHLFLAALYSNSAHPVEAIGSYWEALWRGGDKPHADLLAALAVAYMYVGDGLWAYNAARQHQEYCPDHDVIETILNRARNLDSKGLIDSIDIHFAASGITYTNKSLRYSFKIPPGWRVASEVHNGESNSEMHERIILGLPYVRDDRGGEVENALGIAAMRKPSIEAAKTFATKFLSRFKHSFSKILGEGTDWILYQNQHKGTLYQGRLEARTLGEFVYIVHYSATPGTYNKNIEQIDRWHTDFKTGVDDEK